MNKTKSCKTKEIENKPNKTEHKIKNNIVVDKQGFNEYT